MRRQQWLRTILQEGSEKWSGCHPSGHSVVCSEHFKPDDFKQDLKLRRLKDTACPSIFANCPNINQLSKHTTRNISSEVSNKIGPSDMNESCDSTGDRFNNSDVIVKCEFEETFTCIGNESLCFSDEEIQLIEELKQEIKSLKRVVSHRDAALTRLQKKVDDLQNRLDMFGNSPYQIALKSILKEAESANPQALSLANQILNFSKCSSKYTEQSYPALLHEESTL